VRASLRKLRAQFDWPLAVAMLVIIGLGLVNLYSATRVAPKGLYGHQLGWYAIGVVVFVAAAALDYRVYERMAPLVYGGCIVLLLGVFVFAHNVKGAHRWLPIFGFELQPSELAKLGVLLMLAKMSSLDPQELRARGLPYFILMLAVLALPCALIVLEPDLGTALLIGFIGFSILLFSPARWQTKVQASLLGLALIGVRLLLATIFVQLQLKDYQKKRLLTFLDPSSDPSGAGYHALQSVYAIGSGRWLGKGFLHGTQNQLQFLPEHWTDFPFAVWAEEWGLVGSLLLLACYLFLILWSLGVSATARDRFGQMLAFGAACLLFFHTVVNIGMVSGALPVVGVTLPLFSYGGSSLLTVMTAMGLLMNVSIRRYSY
jgi:rod shape determining protein RodA